MRSIFAEFWFRKQMFSSSFYELSSSTRARILYEFELEFSLITSSRVRVRSLRLVRARARARAVLITFELELEYGTTRARLGSTPPLHISMKKNRRTFDILVDSVIKYKIRRFDILVQTIKGYI